MSSFNSLVCLVAGHDKEYVPYEEIERKRLVSGVMWPYLCKRCGYVSERHYWPEPPPMPQQKKKAEPPLNFQPRVHKWLVAAFGEGSAEDKDERNHRFLEEALELVQACGCTQESAHQLVDYVYGRPVGEVVQEVGGVMTTLAMLCNVQGVDAAVAGEIELARAWSQIEKIRAKRATKPKLGPLP
jgi:hypothetical protein